MSNRHDVRADARRDFLVEQRVRGTVAAREQQSWDLTQATGKPRDAKDPEQRPATMDPNRLARRGYPFNAFDPRGIDYGPHLQPLSADRQTKAAIASDQKNFGASPKAHRRG